ncbi:hypothetical protein BJV78DRAFT_1240972 [Lactifluus subvellereus]|nr:hypothetical protein BJV78DRAFT_1240972 [Lactifluus subvellereus]
MHTSLVVTLLLAGLAYGVALTSAGVRNHWSDPYSLRPNPLYSYPRSPVAGSPRNTSSHLSRFRKDSDISTSHTRPSKPWAAVLQHRQDATGTTQQDLDLRPTPEPTGEPSVRTTVFISNEKDFALLLPTRPGELVSDAEMDAEAFCAPGSSNYLCQNRMPDGFITAASFESADDNSWIQVTGCLDASKFQLDPSDTGGQLDVRFPNGAQCTFGGQGASFIQLVEPALNRFCLRCCRTANDQVNCNSHRDRSGCENAIPGKYDFPELRINCA